MSERKPKPSFVYAFACSDGPAGPVKIGMTDNVQSRLGQIRTSCPFPVTLLHATKLPSRAHADHLEASMHEFYSARWLCGEWFHLDHDIVVQNMRGTERSLQPKDPQS